MCYRRLSFFEFIVIVRIYGVIEMMLLCPRQTTIGRCMMETIFMLFYIQFVLRLKWHWILCFFFKCLKRNSNYVHTHLNNKSVHFPFKDNWHFWYILGFWYIIASEIVCSTFGIRTLDNYIVLEILAFIVALRLHSTIFYTFYLQTR